MSARSLAPWTVVALCVHGVAFAASDRVPHVVAVMEIPMEVELTAPAPEPPPPPAPPPEEPAPEVPVAAPVQVKAAPRAVPAAPRETAARAGALLTAGEASADDDPVAFVTDPNGVSYGSGVVARGGTADHGRGGIVAPPVASAVPGPSRPAGDEVTPAANLSRPAALEEPDACRGFFPSEAMADDGSVDLHVIVLSSGRVSKVSIVRELPERQGFGAAAKTCLLSKRFAPGLDKGGASVTSSAAVRVRFTR